MADFPPLIHINSDKAKDVEGNCGSVEDTRIICGSVEDMRIIEELQECGSVAGIVKGSYEELAPGRVTCVIAICLSSVLCVEFMC